ncbi:MAG: hypothetical protein OJF49_001454 [Ktedonobacterales bacterium]|jgi:hypothetical protein|nr:MAG: hypothetical protein OJF49_001454 [Ktedonobacterales bacterium]
MVGCLLTLFARLMLLFVWILTPLVTRAFQGGWLLPLLGIIFLPFTTLAYVAVYLPGTGVTGWGWFWVALAFLFDLGTHSAAARANRRRISGYTTPGRGSQAQGG